MLKKCLLIGNLWLCMTHAMPECQSADKNFKKINIEKRIYQQLFNAYLHIEQYLAQLSIQEISKALPLVLFMIERIQLRNELAS